MIYFLRSHRYVIHLTVLSLCLWIPDTALGTFASASGSNTINLKRKNSARIDTPIKQIMSSQTNNLNPSKDLITAIEDNSNPNVIQELMAQSFIKSSANLFAYREENGDDLTINLDHGKKHLYSVQDDIKHPIKFKQGQCKTFLSSYEDESNSTRNKRSFSYPEIRENTSMRLPKAFICHRLGPRNAECSLASLTYNITLPRAGMSEKSIGTIVRNIHREMLRRHAVRRSLPILPSNTISRIDTNGNVNKFTKTLSNETHLENTYEIHKPKVRSALGSDYTPKCFSSFEESQYSGLGRKAAMKMSGRKEEPPEEFTFAGPGVDQPSCRWLSKRVAVDCPLEQKQKELRKVLLGEAGRCRRKRSTSSRPSANLGKTARIRFPATHSSVRHTCPCRVVSVIPARTTCADHFRPYSPPKPSCRCNYAEFFLTSTQQGECRTPVPCEGRLARDSANESCDRGGLGTAAAGYCRCANGCSCQRKGPQPQSPAVLGKASCGCSCGCPCGCSCGCGNNYPQKQLGKHGLLEKSIYLLS